MKKYVYIVEEKGCDYDAMHKICSTKKIAEDLAKKMNDEQGNEYEEGDEGHVYVVEYELDKGWC